MNKMRLIIGKWTNEGVCSEWFEGIKSSGPKFAQKKNFTLQQIKKYKKQNTQNTIHKFRKKKTKTTIIYF